MTYLAVGVLRVHKYVMAIAYNY